MAKNDHLYISHMLSAGQEAMELCADLSKDDFLLSRMIQLAAIRLLQEIGETANHVSPSFRNLHPDIPWPKMISMRNFLVHQYLKVDYDVVWETIKLDLPGLVESLIPLQEPTVRDPLFDS